MNIKRFVLMLLIVICSGFIFSSCVKPVEEEVEYKIHFKSDEETISIKTITENQILTLPDKPEKDGYAFCGWYYDKDAWSNPFTLEYLNLNGDITVYAKWLSINSVIFDGNGASSGAMENLDIIECNSIKLPINRYEREGYMFMGWSTAIGEETAYLDEDSITMGKENITLYAVWDSIFDYDIVNGNIIMTGLKYDFYNFILTIPSQIEHEGNNINVIEIAPQAFKGKTPIVTTVIISEGITKIGEEAFVSTMISHVTLPSSIKIIEDNTFNLTDLKNLIIYSITPPEFNLNLYSEMIPGLLNIYVPDESVDSYKSAEGYEAYNENIYSLNVIDSNGFVIIDNTLLRYVGTDSNVTIPDNITVINEWAFALNYNLKCLTIPQSVTLIKDNAFAVCYFLTNIIIEGIEPAVLQEDSFYGIETLHQQGLSFLKIYVPEESVDSYKTAENWNMFADYIYSLNIIDTNGFAIKDNKLIGYICSNNDIILPNNITEINDFALCLSDITYVKLPEGITDIGNCGFGYCINLKQITLPSSITNIGIIAFRECNKLISITIEAETPPQLGYMAFENTDEDFKIYVPSQSIDEYKNAEGWKAYADIIYPI